MLFRLFRLFLPVQKRQSFHRLLHPIRQPIRPQKFPLRNIPVYFQNFVCKPYSQTGAQEFVPQLSVLDALFNVPAAQVRGLLSGTEKWLSWDEMAMTSAQTSTPNKDNGIAVA